MPRHLIESCLTFLTKIEEFLSKNQSEVPSEDSIILQNIKMSFIQLNLTQKKEDYEIPVDDIKKIKNLSRLHFLCGPLTAYADDLTQTCITVLNQRGTLSKSLLDLHACLNMMDPNNFKLEAIPQETIDIFQYLFNTTDFNFLRTINFNALVLKIKESKLIETDVLLHQINCKKEQINTLSRNLEVAIKAQLPKNNEWQHILKNNVIIGFHLNEDKVISPPPKNAVTPQYKRTKSLPNLEKSKYKLNVNTEAGAANFDKNTTFIPISNRRKLKK